MKVARWKRAGQRGPSQGGTHAHIARWAWEANGRPRGRRVSVPGGSQQERMYWGKAGCRGAGQRAEGATFVYTYVPKRVPTEVGVAAGGGPKGWGLSRFQAAAASRVMVVWRRGCRCPSSSSPACLPSALHSSPASKAGLYVDRADAAAGVAAARRRRTVTAASSAAAASSARPPAPAAMAMMAHWGRPELSVLLASVAAPAQGTARVADLVQVLCPACKCKCSPVDGKQGSAVQCRAAQRSIVLPEGWLSE